MAKSAAAAAITTHISGHTFAVHHCESKWTGAIAHFSVCVMGYTGISILTWVVVEADIRQDTRSAITGRENLEGHRRSHTAYVDMQWKQYS